VDLTGINRRPDDLFALSDMLLGQSQKETFPYQIELLGRSFVVRGNVFSPRYNPGADIFAGWLPLREGIDFLEIGSGIGAVSVFAAAAGARKVVATDINPNAVGNTRENIARHGFSAIAEAREGDVFDPIGGGERFDLVFWNIPFALVQEGRELTPLQRSTLDPGYAATSPKARTT
jgi:release factor glutamine methyltransferase